MCVYACVTLVSYQDLQTGIMEVGFARTSTIWVQPVLSITKDYALVAFQAFTNTLITTKVIVLIQQDAFVSRKLIHIHCLGHFERYPYNYSDQRSIYHVRDYEVQKLLRVIWVVISIWVVSKVDMRRYKNQLIS